MLVFRVRLLIIAAGVAICVAATAKKSCAAIATPGSPPAPASRGRRQLSVTAPGARGPGTALLFFRHLEAHGGIYVATGAVEIRYGGLILRADRIVYDNRSGEATATGHVTLDLVAEQTEIAARSGRYNLRTSRGEFDDFHGVSGLHIGRKNVQLQSSNPLIFSGRKLERLGPRRYRLEDGTVTSCRLPRPEWSLSAQQVTVQLGANATLHNAVFRLWDVPVFYFPYLTHPTGSSGRHSGFLLPLVGSSSEKGTILGDSVFWALNRSTNITLGGQYLSARGWGDLVNLISFPTDSSFVSLHLDGVLDRGLALPDGARIKQGGQEAQLIAEYQPGLTAAGVASTTGATGAAGGTDDAQNAGNGGGDSGATGGGGEGWRAVLDANYLSSFIFRLAFTNTFAQAINSEVSSTGFLERQWDGQDLAISANRYQNFFATGPRDSVSLASLPNVDWNSAPRLLAHAGPLPLYFSWDVGGGLFDRDQPALQGQPGFQSGVLERFIAAPQLTVPWRTAAGTITASIAAQTTDYSRRLATAFAGPAPLAVAPGLGLAQNSGVVNITWTPPPLEKVYQTPGGLLGQKLKHVFQPLVTYRFRGGVSDPDDVIRFDGDDILSDTDELDYGFTNAFYTRDREGRVRELASWRLEQMYFFDPTFGGALIPGQENVFQATAMLTPFAFATQALNQSPIDSLLRVSPFAGFDGDWRLDYDPRHHRVDDSAFTGSFHIGQWLISGSEFVIHTPLGLIPLGGVLPAQYNQVQLTTGYGDPSRPGLSVAFAAAYDSRLGRLQYTTAQATYNWSCAGLSFQYRRFALATLRRENEYRINFTLANVATFGNLKTQERIF
ncbi:MAG: LPS-assembly protein LptD [Terriglobales bacterium]